MVSSKDEVLDYINECKSMKKSGLKYMAVNYSLNKAGITPTMQRSNIECKKMNKMAEKFSKNQIIIYILSSC
jgi:hypothetical protein